MYYSRVSVSSVSVDGMLVHKRNLQLLFYINMHTTRNPPLWSDEGVMRHQPDIDKCLNASLEHRQSPTVSLQTNFFITHWQMIFSGCPVTVAINTIIQALQE